MHFCRLFFLLVFDYQRAHKFLNFTLVLSRILYCPIFPLSFIRFAIVITASTCRLNNYSNQHFFARGEFMNAKTWICLKNMQIFSESFSSKIYLTFFLKILSSFPIKFLRSFLIIFPSRLFQTIKVCFKNFLSQFILFA